MKSPKVLRGGNNHGYIGNKVTLEHTFRLIHLDTLSPRQGQLLLTPRNIIFWFKYSVLINIIDFILND